MLGMNVDYRHWTDFDSLASDIATRFKCKWIRTVLKPVEQGSWNTWYDMCHKYGVNLLAVQTNESGDIGHYEEYKFDALQVGNEPDQIGESSDTLTPTELNSILIRARIAMPFAYIVCAGMASGDPTYLLGVDLNLVNAIAIHPYIETPQTIDAFLRLYKVYGVGLPIWITEYPQTNLVRLLDRHPSVQVAMFFCYDEIMVKGFGLLNYGLLVQPKFDEYLHEVKDVVEFILGFATYASQHPEVGEPVENEWTERTVLDVVRCQNTTTGTLRYYRATNTIVFYPKD